MRDDDDEKEYTMGNMPSSIVNQGSYRRPHEAVLRLDPVARLEYLEQQKQQEEQKRNPESVMAQEHNPNASYYYPTVMTPAASSAAFMNISVRSESESPGSHTSYIHLTPKLRCHESNGLFPIVSAAETIPSDAKQASDNSKTAAVAESSLHHLSRNPMLALVVVVYTAVCGINISCNEVLALELISPRSKLGLALKAPELALLFSLVSLQSLVVNIYFSKIVERVGHVRLLRGCLLFYSLSMIAFGVLGRVYHAVDVRYWQNSTAYTGRVNFLVHSHHHVNEDKVRHQYGPTTLIENFVPPHHLPFLFVMVYVLAVSLMKVAASSFVFTLSMLFIANTAPTRVLGRVTGFAHGCGSFARCVMPMLATPCFALSMSPTAIRLFGPIPELIFCFLAICAFACFLFSLRLEEAQLMQKVIRSRNRQQTNHQRKRAHSNENQESNSVDVSTIVLTSRNGVLIDSSATGNEFQMSSTASSPSSSRGATPEPRSLFSRVNSSHALS